MQKKNKQDVVWKGNKRENQGRHPELDVVECF